MTNKGPYRTEKTPRAPPDRWRRSTKLLISAYLLAWLAALLHLAKIGVSVDRLLNLGTIAVGIHAVCLAVYGVWQRDNENTERDNERYRKDFQVDDEGGEEAEGA